jgi:hypothetical protein
MKKVSMKEIVALLLLTIMTFLMAGTAFANGREVKAPSDIEIQLLEPAPDSEVILDEVMLIKSKKEKGDIVRFEYTLEPEEAAHEGDLELIVDHEKGTYKATYRPFVPDEVKQRTNLPPVYQIEPTEHMIEPKQLNQIEGTGVLTKAHTGYHSSGATVVPGEYAQYAAILTEDPLNMDLLQTTQWLHWYGMGWNQGFRSVWTWAAFPSAFGTYWYVGGTNDFPITNGSTYCTSRWWAWYYNYDFGQDNLRTTVTHDLYIYGYWSGGFTIQGYTQRTGEGYGLLHSHVLHWFYPA